MFARFAVPMLLVATIASSSPVSPFPNQALQCGSVGGALAYVTVPDAQDLRMPASFTIEAWMRADPNQTLSAYPIVLIKPAGNRPNGECTYGFILERATGRLTFRVTTSTGTFNATGSANLLDGQWHHVAGVRDADILRLYVDGISVQALTIGGVPVQSTDLVCMGGSKFTGYEGNGLVGQLDEVRIWSVARASADLGVDRYRVLNGKPGLVAAWHFDRWYPGMLGTLNLLDGVRQFAASTNGVASLALGGSPVSRGSGLSVSDVVCQENYGLRTMSRVERVGSRDVVYREHMGLNGPDAAGLDVVQFGSGPRVLGSLGWAPETPIVRMAGRDSVVFCLKAVGSSHRLVSVRVSDPSSPVVFGDSLYLYGSAKLTLDPATPTLLLAAGTSAGENYLSLVDVTNAAAPVLWVAADLGATFSMGSIVDVTKRGSYLYATFNNGTLRVFRFAAAVVNGNVLRTINPVGSTITVSGAPSVAVSGSRLYVAGNDGTLRAFDLAVPDAPALLGSADVSPAFAREVRVVDATTIAIAGENGVHLVGVSNPAAMGVLANYDADAQSAGGSSLSVGGNLVGLCAGVGGYTQLVPSALVGVDEPVSAPATRLAAGPNPSRDRVWFRLPGEIADDARLEVFDLAGRRVREWSAPSGTVTWDGSDHAGTRVPAGTYFARLRSSGREWKGRVTIVR